MPNKSGSENEATLKALRKQKIEVYAQKQTIAAKTATRRLSEKKLAAGFWLNTNQLLQTQDNRSSS